MSDFDPVTFAARQSIIRSRAIREAEEFVRAHIWALEDAVANSLRELYLQAYNDLARDLTLQFLHSVQGETWKSSDYNYRERTEALLRQINSEIEVLTRQVEDQTLDAAIRAYGAGYYGRAWALETGLRGGSMLSLPLLPTDAIRAAILAPHLGSTFLDRFANTREEFVALIRRSIVESQIRGEGIYAAVMRLRRWLGLTGTIPRSLRARMEMIARTEILRASNLGAMSIYETNRNLLKGWEWLATKDERTCFSAGTNIATELGPIPIEKIMPGMRILTRDGLHTTLSKMERRYCGRMVTVYAGGRTVTATDDHPFWADGHWRLAKKLKRYDRLQTFNQETIQIDRLIYFFCGKGARSPAGHAANIEATSNRDANSKSFSASGAYLGDSFASMIFQIALAGTVFIIVLVALEVVFEALTAMFAIGMNALVGGGMIAFSGAIIAALAMRGRKLFSTVANHYQTVYNLEIEGAHEFYANGILVHNCPTCGALDGQGFPFDFPQSPPPAHPQCRCTPVPILLDSELELAIVGPRETYQEWAQRRGITIIQDGGVLRFRGAPPPKSSSPAAKRGAPNLYPI